MSTSFVVAVVGVVAAVVTVVVVTVLMRRRRVATGDVDTTDGAHRRRSLPRHLTLDDLSLRPPPDGRALVVLFSTSECAACLPARRRLDRIAHADVVEIDLTGSPEAAVELGVDGVPALLVYGSDGVLVRSWIGEPLAGTLERAVDTAAGVA